MHSLFPERNGDVQSLFSADRVQERARLDMQSFFPEERVHERVGLPCSPGFQRQIKESVIKLREQCKGRGCIIYLSRFLHLGLANAQRYSLIHGDDFAAVLAFQTVFPGLFRVDDDRLFVATIPGPSPTPFDYAVQVAAFYFAYTHEEYGIEFRRLLQPDYRRRVMNSHTKWRAAILRHSQKQGQRVEVPPGFTPDLMKKPQLKEF